MSKLIVSSLIVLLFSLILYHFYFSTNTNCPKGYFRLKGMKYCHKQLTCVDYQNMIVLKQFQQGLVKKVYLVKWNEFHIVLAQLTHQNFKDDFVHNINTLEALSPSSQVILTVLYTVTAVTAFTGNIIVLIVLILGHKSSRELKKFLINLSLSDISMSIFSIPFTYTDIMLGRWIFARYLCHLASFMTTCGMSVSIYTLTLISVER